VEVISERLWQHEVKQQHVMKRDFTEIVRCFAEYRIFGKRICSWNLNCLVC